MDATKRGSQAMLGRLTSFLLRAHGRFRLIEQLVQEAHQGVERERVQLGSRWLALVE